MNKCHSIIFVVLMLAFGHLHAQTTTTTVAPGATTTTVAPATPQSCKAATGISFNQTSLFGYLYEVARQPVNANLGCVEVSTKLLHDNSTLNTNVTFSTTPNNWYANITESANITLLQNDSAGYNVSFTRATTPSFIKLLEIYTTKDGVKWVAGCSYSNASDSSTVFAFLLSNARQVNQTGLNFVYNLASKTYSDFKPTTANVAAINQQNCYTNSASTALPLLTGCVAVLFVLLKSLGLA